MSKGTCTVDGCERLAHARGWCKMHYKRWRKTGDPRPDTPPRRFGGSCSVDGCDGPLHGRGLCNAHYLRWWNHGDPDVLLIARGSGRSMLFGYVRVYRPGHPFANGQGWLFEHRLVAYEAGLLTDPSDDVHHINGDKTDNRIENLAVLPHAEHSREHARLRAKKRAAR